MPKVPAKSQLARAAVALDKVDSKAMLGYAYLRKLASEADFTCTWVGQHSDGWGVDVRLDVHEELDPQARLKDFALDFQLRITSPGLPVVDGKFLFSLEVDRYETLRSATSEDRALSFFSACRPTLTTAMRCRLKTSSLTVAADGSASPARHKPRILRQHPCVSRLGMCSRRRLYGKSPGALP